jgi:hypothetical protein
MFTGLKENSGVLKDPTMLSFDVFVHTCDVAGALGHVNNQSSLVYTEPSHSAMQTMWAAVKILSEQGKEEIDAYNAYLKVRASWLGLSSTDKYDRVLARIGAMLRLFTVEEGRVLKKAMLDLDSNTRDKIASALDIKKKSLNLRTPTYMPAVLVNLSKNSELGTSKEKRLVKAMTIGLPFIAKILEQHKKLVVSDKIDPRIPLCFNVAAGIAKKKFPNLLNGKFKIDQKNGNVLPVTK